MDPRVQAISLLHPPRVYALPEAVPFAKAVVRCLAEKNPEMGVLREMAVKKFANTESCVTIKESVRGCDVFLVSWATGDVNELVMNTTVALGALRLASAHKVTLVLPMMPYARQDRKDAARQPITAKLIAGQFEKAGADHVITMELHAAQIQGFFSVPVDNLYSLTTFVSALAPAFAAHGKPIVAVSPDAGGGKRAVALWNRLRRAYAGSGTVAEGMVIMHKVRDPETGKVASQTIVGDVRDRVCVVVDDMADTCGTLVGAVRELKAAGADKVYAVITHAVFSRDAVEKIEGCEALEKIFVADTCLSAPVPKQSKIGGVSMAPDFAEAMHRNYTSQSVSALFA